MRIARELQEQLDAEARSLRRRIGIESPTTGSGSSPPHRSDSPLSRYHIKNSFLIFYARQEISSKIN